MLLHDSSFYPSNMSTSNASHSFITLAYSPLFHSPLTLIISLCGICFNFICAAKIWLIIDRYQERKAKSSPQQLEQHDESRHILAHNRYRYLLVLSGNDFLLCLSSVISCLDETFFFQSFLARHQLCAAQILVWKFTLHFLPLLTVFILCRYHFILNRNFQMRHSNLSTLNQLLCTDLSILVPFVLALAWSVDGLWLWGVVNIKDVSSATSQSIDESGDQNLTRTLLSNHTLAQFTERHHEDFFHPEQKIICFFQANHDRDFSLRLVYLIQADFLLLFSLHLLGNSPRV